MQPTAGGCGRAGVIGCGVVTLLLGIAAIIFLLKAGDLFAWALGRFEVEITQALPEDFSEAERERLHRAFGAAADAVRSGEFDPASLQRLQTELRESLLDDDQKLSREQVLELTEILEEVGGGGQEPEASSGEDSSPPVGPTADP